MIELEDEGRVVGPPVGAISVLLPAGYGNEVLVDSTGVSEVDSSGLATELEEEVGPAVGATTVAFDDGIGNGIPVPSLTVLEEKEGTGVVVPAVG